MYLATYFGLPISVSHSLIGGFIGSALLAGGPGVIILTGIIIISVFVFAAPIIGMIGGSLFSLFIKF